MECGDAVRRFLFLVRIIELNVPPTMPVITLPDGSQRTYSEPTNVAKIAADIGPGLAKAAVAGKVDGKLVDASDVIDHDARVQIITPEGSGRAGDHPAFLRPSDGARRQAAVPDSQDGHRAGHR